MADKKLAISFLDWLDEVNKELNDNFGLKTKDVCKNYEFSIAFLSKKTPHDAALSAVEKSEWNWLLQEPEQTPDVGDYDLIDPSGKEIIDERANGS